MNTWNISLSPTVGGFFAVLLLCSLSFLAVPAHADFSFVHITDTHFTAAEGEESNAAKNMALYREISTLSPAPACVINTGDIVEIGTDAEYAVFRKASLLLTPPTHIAPGNHDVRWNPRGKEGYEKGANATRYHSWDVENVHFVLLDSTVLLQHWGHFDQAQLAWLAADLKKVGQDKPVIIGFHHWIGRDTVQVDNENDLLRVLAPYNVRLFLIGHGHSDIHWNVNGTPAIMAKGLYQGSYHWVKVTGASLTVYRRTAESGKPDLEVLTEPLAKPRQPRGVITLTARSGLASSGTGSIIFERGDFGPESKVVFRFDDGKQTAAVSTPYGWMGSVDLSSLQSGFHLLTVSITTPENRTYHTPLDFSVEAPPGLRPLWQASIGGEVQGKLAVGQEMVYVPSMGGDMVALEAKTGKEKWRFRTKGAVFSAPLVVEKTVYFGSADHFIYAVDAKTGKQRWRTETQGAVFAGAALANGILCVASTDTKIYGLNAGNGKILWTAQGENMYQSQAVTDGTRFFVGGWDNQFRCLDARTGQELWKQPFGKHEKSGKYLFYFAPAIGSPTVANGTVYITSNDGMLHALEAATGKILWEVPGPALGYSGPLHHEGRIYNASLTPTGRVFCFDATTGKTLWESPTGSVIYDSSCAFGQGKVFVGSVNGTFSALDAARGDLLWQFRLPPGHLLASPAVDTERVYIGSLSGQVFAFPAK